MSESASSDRADTSPDSTPRYILAHQCSNRPSCTSTTNNLIVPSCPFFPGMKKTTWRITGKDAWGGYSVLSSERWLADELEGVEFRRLTDEAQPHVAAAQ